MLYNDIWVSIGTELESARREAELGPYWINESLVKLAKPEALDCLPAHRGQEIDAKVFEANAGTIFRSGREQAPLAESVLEKRDSTYWPGRRSVFGGASLPSSAAND